jgi:hypothetical protein
LFTNRKAGRRGGRCEPRGFDEGGLFSQKTQFIEPRSGTSIAEFLSGKAKLARTPPPETVFHEDSGKGWFIIVRLYSPLEPFLTKKWRPSEIELVR